jgi:hypothetical protein
MKSPFSRTWAALAFALAVLISQSAWAQPVGTQGFADTDNPTANTSDITTASSFTLGSGALFGSTGSQTGLFIGMSTQSFGPLTLDVLGGPPASSLDVPFATSSLSFGSVGSVFGKFTSTETELIAYTTGVNASVAYLVEGNWTAGTYASGFTGNTYAASMTFAITQTGGPGNAIGDTATFAVPPSPLVITPEPSTVVIAGLGALGMIGYGLRRRKALGA